MPTTDKRPLKVFLSYASQDRLLVRELSRRLTGEGWIDTWQDEKNLLPGQDWRVKIEEAVEEADVVIIVLSQHSVSKEGHVQKELRYAREIALEKPEDAIFLIPLRLDECEVPRGLRFYQWVDYFDDKKDVSYKALVASLKLRYEQKLKAEKEERLRKEQLEREAAEKVAREKAKKEADEKARLQAEEEERKRIAREKANREATEKAAREKAKNEADENVRLEPIKVTSRWNTRRIVSVWSNSVEAGRQVFIANLATQAALTGMRVGLFDIEFTLPTIHSMFGLDESDIEVTINDYLHGRVTIDKVGLPIHENVSQTSKLTDTHMWLFPASIKSNDILRIHREGYDVGLLNDGIRDAIAEFNLDCLFINLPSNMNEEILLATAISDALIIVLRPDRKNIQGSAVMVDTAKKLDIPRLFLTVNKALPKYDFAELQSRVEQIHDAIVLGVLPLFDDIEDDANAGLFSLNFPSHKWSRGLCSVAQTLFEH